MFQLLLQAVKSAGACQTLQLIPRLCSAVWPSCWTKYVGSFSWPWAMLESHLGHFRHSRASQTAVDIYVWVTESPASAWITIWITLPTPVGPLPHAQLVAHSQMWVQGYLLCCGMSPGAGKQDKDMCPSEKKTAGEGDPVTLYWCSWGYLPHPLHLPRGTRDSTVSEPEDESLPIHQLRNQICVPGSNFNCILSQGWKSWEHEYGQLLGVSSFVKVAF